jgi:hypothetical protein
MAAAQRLQSYLCCKCSSRTPNHAYAFGNVQFRHARPSIAQCRALLEWLDAELAKVCEGASHLVVMLHVRAFRSVLEHVQLWKEHMKPWLHAIEEERLATEKATAAAAAATAAGAPAPVLVPPPPSPLFTDPTQLAHLKGCIRQGKKLGLNFPENFALKKRYDASRKSSSSGSGGQQQGSSGDAPSTSSAHHPSSVTPSASSAVHPPSASAGAASKTREILEIE